MYPHCGWEMLNMAGLIYVSLKIELSDTFEIEVILAQMKDFQTD